MSATRRLMKCVALGASNQTGSDVTVIARAGCNYSRAFPMHTQVILDAFHGNWWEDSANSPTVTMYC